MLSPLAALMLASVGAIPPAPFLMVDGVRVGGQGSFRMLADSGGESTVLDPAVAERLGLLPQYRIEVESVNGVTLVPATRATVSFGGKEIANAEILLYRPGALAADAEGILGQNVLSQFDYLAEPSRGRLVLDETGEIRASLPGSAVPFLATHGRMRLPFEIGGQAWTLSLDSGSSSTVLFRTPGGWVRQNFARLATHAGLGLVSVGVVRLFTDGWSGSVSAAVAPRVARTGEDGLLAFSSFQWVYVSNSARSVMLGPPAQAWRLRK